MKIAIHPVKESFSERWIDYCEKERIHWKKVNCYNNDIIKQLGDCDALLWHFSHNDPKAILIARPLIYSLEKAGKKVFPNFHTVWHFDDKLGQKYLLESINAPLVPTWVFYDKNQALEWAESTDFPKVFKLRRGAASQNVRLIKNKKSAFKFIRKAFRKGFPAYDPVESLKERWRKYKLGTENLEEIAQGFARFVVPPPYSTIIGRERGYIYFQKYIPGNDHDIRVVVIGEKAFAIKRMVRNNDFRASGSGKILYSHNLFKDSTIRLSFYLAEKLGSQCVAFDFLQDNGSPLLTEISYGFSPGGYDRCTGYWDKNMTWHEGTFNPYGWMIDDLLKA